MEFSAGLIWFQETSSHFVAARGQSTDMPRYAADKLGHLPLMGGGGGGKSEGGLTFALVC